MTRGHFAKLKPIPKRCRKNKRHDGVKVCSRQGCEQPPRANATRGYGYCLEHHALSMKASRAHQRALRAIRGD